MTRSSERQTEERRTVFARAKRGGRTLAALRQCFAALTTTPGTRSTVLVPTTADAIAQAAEARHLLGRVALPQVDTEHAGVVSFANGSRLEFRAPPRREQLRAVATVRAAW